jgi:hypothetical protein
MITLPCERRSRIVTTPSYSGGREFDSRLVDGILFHDFSRSLQG